MKCRSRSPRRPSKRQSAQQNHRACLSGGFLYGSPSGSDFERGGVCFAFGFVRRCGSGGDIAFEVHLPSRFYRRVCLRFTPALAVLSPRLPLVHACLFSFVRKKETACDMLRSYSAGSRSPSCVLAVSVRLSAFVSSLRVWIFFYGDLDGLPGCGGRGTGLAARPLCVFAQPHWRCCAFRGEYAGAARPRLRQRVECGSGTAASLDSLHAAAGLCWCVFAAFVRFCASALALESFRGEYAGAARPRLRQRVFDSLDSPQGLAE